MDYGLMLAKLSAFLCSCFMMLLLTACSNMFASSDESGPPSSSLFDNTITKSTGVSPTVPKQIALLLPLQGDLGNAGKAIQAGFNDAYQKSSLKPVIKVYDTSQSNDIDALYDKAVSGGANYIVGPLDKAKVATLEHHQNIPVITIALNNPDTSFYNTNLYEFALSPTDEAKQIADAASKSGYAKALMITPAGSWGQNIANTLQKRFQNNGGMIVGSIAVNNDDNLNMRLRTLLEVQGTTQRQDFDVIFMIVQPALARKIKPLLQYYHVGNTPVYSTSLVYSGLLSPEKDQDLNGVEFCDMPLTIASEGQWAALRQEMMLAQPAAIQRYIRLYGLGYDAALLTQNFGELSKGMSAATGYLTLDQHNDILRKLNFATFENGLPQSVS